MKKGSKLLALGMVLIIASFFSAGLILTKDYNINLTNPDWIIVYKDMEESPPSFYEGTEVYGSLLELYKESSITSYLNAFLQGSFNEEAFVQNKWQTNVDDLYLTEGKVFIEFNYTTNQTVTLNNQIYINPVTNETNIQYKSILIEVLPEDNLNQVNFYIKHTTIKTNGQYDSYYRFVVYQDQTDLYEFIEELSLNG